jgi:quinol monooxygenase YgiN
MLMVTGRICTAPRLAAELLNDLQQGVERSRGEDGCFFYSFAMEDGRAGHLLTIQIWRDEAALAGHLATPEIGTFIAKWTGRYDVQTKLYDVDNERPVGIWTDPAHERLVRESRSSSNR